MISGDKADTLFNKAKSESKTSGECSQTSLFSFQQRLSSCIPQCSNYDMVSDQDFATQLESEDVVTELDVETLETEGNVCEIEHKINEIVGKLNGIRTQNRNLEKIIESKLKKNHCLAEYCNSFDKYVLHASNVLNKIFNKFTDKIVKLKDSSSSSLKSSDSSESKPNLSVSSFISFLSIKKIQDLVEGMSAIGHGGEGRVYRAHLISTGAPVVVKSYFMDCEQSSKIEYAMLVLCNNVPGVKKPVGLFQTATNYYLIMEDDHKSIPLDVLAEKGVLTENQIQHLFSQMVYILYDLRNKFIKHRDVKLDNFLLNTETGRLCIIDFGWAMYTALDQVTVDEVKRSGETLMGTFDYLPPEADSPPGTIVSYDKATVFALGCILLELFFGYQGKARIILSKESLTGYINRMSSIKCKEISKGAISILDRCLKLNPNERLNLDEVLLHPWVPSDKIDNSLFSSINRINNGIVSPNANTSLPCHLNRQHSACSQ